MTRCLRTFASSALAALVLAAVSPPAAGQSQPAAPARLHAAEPLRPLGASALDAWAAWREAEGGTYRLAEDGVRTFSCRVECSLVDLLSAPGAPLSGDPPRITLYWRAGDASAVVEGSAALDSDARGRLAALVEPLADIILPMRPTRGLSAHSFRFVGQSEWLRFGERGLEAVARRADADPTRAMVAIGPDGLVARERIERADGSVSEFEYEHVLRDGRHLLKAARGTFRGMHVAIHLEWEGEATQRPLPTRVEVEQVADDGGLPKELATQVFRFSRHQVNGDIPADILPLAGDDSQPTQAPPAAGAR